MEFPKDDPVEESPRKENNEKPARINRKITKVKDLLRESQENALQMNKADLDKMFNLQVMKPDAALSDSVSKQYLEKISSLREQ
jgi:hypothetical protein